MTTLILDGYIVKEKTDNGKMFYYSTPPDCCGDRGDREFCVGNDNDLCFEVILPIKEFVETDYPVKCKITIELEK